MEVEEKKEGQSVASQRPKLWDEMEQMERLSGCGRPAEDNLNPERTATDNLIREAAPIVAHQF